MSLLGNFLCNLTWTSMVLQECSVTAVRQLLPAHIRPFSTAHILLRQSVALASANYLAVMFEITIIRYYSY